MTEVTQYRPPKGTFSLPSDECSFAIVVPLVALSKDAEQLVGGIKPPKLASEKTAGRQNPKVKSKLSVVFVMRLFRLWWDWLASYSGQWLGFMRRAVVAYSIAFSLLPLVKVQTRAEHRHGSPIPAAEDGWVDVGGNKGVHRHRRGHTPSPDTPLRLRLEVWVSSA